MNREDLTLSGLNPASQALSGNDLILLTQNTPNGLQSVNATLARLLQYLFVDSGAIDNYIGQTFLKQVYTLNSNSGLIGDGRSSNPMSVNFSYLDTLYVNETDFTNYQNNVNTQINNINNSISQGVVPNTRKINTGAGLVGGGNLSADRTISMGAPSSITSGSSNSASGDTHSHELAPGAVTNTKIANNSVTDAKIVSMSASKITGVIPSANLPPASAPVNVIDNLTSNSVNDALSANQGRVLSQQIASKFNSTGGTITGPIHLFTGENSVSLKMDGVLHIGYQLLFRKESTNQTEFSIGTASDSVVMIAYDRRLIFEAERYEYLDSEGGWLRHTSNAGKGKYNFDTDCNVFEFNKLVYMANTTYNRVTNGYSYLSNGMLMQWGFHNINYNPGENVTTITFPIAFPNACLNATATRVTAASAVGTSDGGLCIHAFSNTELEIIYNTYPSGSSDLLRGCYWMAIGF